MYAKFFKRVIDFTLSLVALMVLSPVLLVLTLIGAIAMKGNPFSLSAVRERSARKRVKKKYSSLLNSGL